MASRIDVFTASTAFFTPLPRYRDLSPSRSSHASCSPVLAPEGTAARPTTPLSRMTSTSTVGLPRESRISRPLTSEIAESAIVDISLILEWRLVIQPESLDYEMHKGGTT